MNPILPNEIWAMIVKYKRQDYETAKTFLEQHLYLRPMVYDWHYRFSGNYVWYAGSYDSFFIKFQYSEFTNERRIIYNNYNYNRGKTCVVY